MGSTPMWEWINQAGGIFNDVGQGICTDINGNSYVTGYFNDTATFSNIVLTSRGNTETDHDIFAGKLDPSGNWQWVAHAKSVKDCQGLDISVDSANNSYITGYFRDTISFDNINLSTSDKEEIFVAKLNPNGSFLWTIQAGNMNESDRGKSIKVDCDGNSYVSGSFRGMATFGTITLTSDGTNQPNIFIAKVDTDGNWTWVTRAGGISPDSGEGISLDCDNNVYVTGYFNGTATFGTTILTGNNLSEDAFVAKLDENGNWKWITQVGGINADQGLSINAECSNNVYVTGFFNNTATFGSTILTSIGSDDIFIAKLDGSTGTWEWAKQAGSTDSDQGLGIDVDAEGNSYVTGFFNSTATFGTTFLTSFGSSDIFITKLDCDGNWKWAINAGGEFADQGLDISVDPVGNVYVTGSFQSTSTFGTTVLTTIDAGPLFRRDIFLAKLSTTNSTTNLNLECFLEKATSITISFDTLKCLTYNISYREVGAMSFIAGPTVDGDGSTKTVTIDSLIENTEYEFKVDSIYKCCSIIDSDIVICRTLCIDPEWEWATPVKIIMPSFTNNKAGKPEKPILGTDISIDCENNSYVTGSFNGTATFGTIVLTSELVDIFIGKLDPSGDWQWVQQAGGGFNDNGYSISVDLNNNSYVTGFFEGTATFGTIILNTFGGSDIFVAKLDPIGNWQWIIQVGDIAEDTGYGITVDQDGNSYITGSFSNTVTFGTTILTSANSTDIFVGKIDTDGSWQWATQSIGSQSAIGFDISRECDGDLYVTGTFTGSVTFGSLMPLNSNPPTSSEIFVAKLDQDGNWLWATQADGSESNQGKAIDSDCDGNSYVTGIFRNATTFGSVVLTSMGNNDIFISKLDTNGNWIWTRQAGGDMIDDGLSISVDCQDNVYVTGSFENTASFGNIILISENSTNGFVGKLRLNGDWEWVNPIKGASIGYGIHANCEGDTYITGLFGGTTTFSNITIESEPIDSQNIFISKIPTTNCPPEPLTLECLEKATAIDVIFNVNTCFTYTATLLGNTLITTTADPGANRIGFTGLTPDTEYDFEVVATDKCGILKDSDNITCRTLCKDPEWEWITQIELIPSTGLTSFIPILQAACVGSLGYEYSILNGYIEGYKDIVDIIDRYFYSGKILEGCIEIGELQNKTLLPGFFGINSDCDNNVYITNSFEGTATFGTFVLTSTGRHDIFVAKLDDLGNTIWVNQAGSTDSSDSGYDIKVDKFGNSYVMEIALY
jgi:hypothetical protein